MRWQICICQHSMSTKLIKLHETDKQVPQIYKSQQPLRVCLFPGGPASTQRGGADGFAGWITLPRFPPLPGRPHGGHPRGREASQHPVSFQHHQRQVQKHTKKPAHRFQINQILLPASLTDFVCV